MQHTITDKNESVDALWEDLNLGGLLNDLARENESALAQAKRIQAKRDPFKKHNKMLKNPAYSVLMDRYGAAPPKPKFLAKSTLNRLSDPVKGRHVDSDSDKYPHRVRVMRDTKMHPRNNTKQKNTRDMSRDYSYDKNIQRDSYDHSPIRKQAWVESSPRKFSCRPDSSSQKILGGDTFFLTGTNDEAENYDDDKFESPSPSPATLRRKMQQCNGPEVSPIEVGLESPQHERDVYSPPDIYSPRTKEALRDSFNKEQAALLPPPKKAFNPLQNSKTTSTSKKSNLYLPKKKSKKKKKICKKTGKQGDVMTRNRGNVSVASKGRRTRDTVINESQPSKRVQLLSNKLSAKKILRAGPRGNRSSDATGGPAICRSSSVENIRSSKFRSDGPANSHDLRGSRSAPSFKQNIEKHSHLPRVAQLSSQQTSLPALRTKNLLGRKSVSPALQERYAEILQSSREAHQNDPPQTGKMSSFGFGDKSSVRKGSLQPIKEKQTKTSKAIRKMKHNIDIEDRISVNGPPQSNSITADVKMDKEIREERLRKEKQEKRMLARANASKKREDMDFRTKIRQEAEANASKGRIKSQYETVDDKLISMFKSHCIKLSNKLSDAEKLSADFKAFREYDGYSSTDRSNLHSDIQCDKSGTTSDSSNTMPTKNPGGLILSEPLMM